MFNIIKFVGREYMLRLLRYSRVLFIMAAVNIVNRYVDRQKERRGEESKKAGGWGGGALCYALMC